MIVFHIICDLSIIKGKVVDHTIKELGRHLYIYNTLREDG